MKFLYFFSALNLSLILIRCAPQTENSFSDDAKIYGVVDGSEKFLNFRTIIVDECSACHGDFASYTAEQWVSLGYVVASDSTNSKLYRRIRGSSVGGEEDMPPISILSPAQRETIVEWINSL
ncbi:MAG: hypothetical protein CL678_12830 [Bdellovibrionaceae bacterium]|nr:hypothetical protein [Pseudobdellovibrionaceae bacterium]|tara:strand:- start:13709 stop:14074 length:366 start_codon:yes stop_codon:yes gene_type:complete